MCSGAENIHGLPHTLSPESWLKQGNCNGGEIPTWKELFIHSEVPRGIICVPVFLDVFPINTRRKKNLYMLDHILQVLQLNCYFTSQVIWGGESLLLYNSKRGFTRITEYPCNAWTQRNPEKSLTCWPKLEQASTLHLLRKMQFWKGLWWDAKLHFLMAHNSDKPPVTNWKLPQDRTKGGGGSLAWKRPEEVFSEGQMFESHLLSI